MLRTVTIIHCTYAQRSAQNALSKNTKSHTVLMLQTVNGLRKKHSKKPLSHTVLMLRTVNGLRKKHSKKHYHTLYLCCAKSTLKNTITHCTYAADRQWSAQKALSKTLSHTVLMLRTVNCLRKKHCKNTITHCTYAADRQRSAQKALSYTIKTLTYRRCIMTHSISSSAGYIYVLLCTLS